MLSKKRRIEFIDIAKGIAIFLVIWGHTATNEELTSAECGLIPRILYSFHMPLFFFLAGLSMKDTPLKTWVDWKAFFKKNILTIAFPYLIWSLVYCTFNYQNVAWIFYGSWQGLGKCATLTSLWFLSCLFIAKIFVELVVSFINKKIWIVVAILLLVAGLLIPSIEIGYPWCIDAALVASSCILFGLVLKKPLIELSVQRLIILLAILVGLASLYIGSLLIDKDNFVILMMCKNQYGTGIGVFIRAITGSLAVIILSMIFHQLAESILPDKAIKPLIYIGQYTMGIFILHKPFLQQVVIPLMTNLTGDFFPVWLIRLLCSLIVMVLCLPVCNLIIHYVPELIGIFSKDKLKLKEKI